MIPFNFVLVRSITNAAGLNAVISFHLHHRRLGNAVTAFYSNPHHRNTASWNLLISAYARHDRLDLANSLFDQMPQRDIVSWNAILAAHRRAGEHLKTFQIFTCMLRLNLRPTGSTLATIIAASVPVTIPQLHAVVLLSGHTSNTVVGTALVDGYASTGDAVAVRQAFEDIPSKNSVSWTALILGFLRIGRTADARRTLDGMPGKTVVAATALISGLIANGEVAQARKCFDAMENRNAITWTVMIAGHFRHGRFSDALRLFAAAPYPNRFTYSAALASSARLCSLRSGECIHARIVKSGEQLDEVLVTALVDLYGRCGEVDSASLAFDAACSDCSAAAWNAMIGAMGMNGRGEAAAAEFWRMVARGVALDGTTFVHVLSACAHAGMVEEGERIFGGMDKEFGVKVEKEHYGCMVDLYGRAGLKEKAEALKGVWEEVKERMHAGEYLLMARIYGEMGEWEKVGEIKELMEASMAGKKRKHKGVSWVESII